MSNYDAASGNASGAGEPLDVGETGASVRGFARVYEMLANYGLCPPQGSADYYRILEEWMAAGSPAEMDKFIEAHASSGPA